MIIFPRCGLPARSEHLVVIVTIISRTPSSAWWRKYDAVTWLLHAASTSVSWQRRSRHWYESDTHATVAEMLMCEFIAQKSRNAARGFAAHPSSSSCSGCNQARERQARRNIWRRHVYHCTVLPQSLFSFCRVQLCQNATCIYIGGVSVCPSVARWYWIKTSDRSRNI